MLYWLPVFAAYFYAGRRLAVSVFHKRHLQPCVIAACPLSHDGLHDRLVAVANRFVGDFLRKFTKGGKVFGSAFAVYSFVTLFEGFQVFCVCHLTVTSLLLNQNWRLSGCVLEALQRHRAIAGVKFYRSALSSGILTSNDSGAGSVEWLKN